MLKLSKAVVIFMAVVLLTTPALFACGKKEEAKPQAGAEGPGAMMPGQTGGPMMAQGQKAGESPHGMGMPGGAKAERKVVVPQEVANKWKGVKITVIDKKTGGKGTTYTLNLNENFTVPGSKLVLKVDAFLPNFTMSGDSITSTSNEPKNPACHMIIQEGGKESKNWLFANFPEMHPVDHPQFKILLAAGVPK